MLKCRKTRPPAPSTSTDPSRISFRACLARNVHTEAALSTLPPAFRLRPEQPADAPAIDGLLRAAFAGHPHSDHTEHLIVERLRARGRLALALLVETPAGEVVGHVAFSPVVIDGHASDWMGLGPLAVLPACQGQGIGSALVRAGMAALARQGCAGCVVLGEPEYYRRFGFAVSGLRYPSVPAAYFMARSFNGLAPVSGTVGYDAAFAGETG